MASARTVVAAEIARPVFRRDNGLQPFISPDFWTWEAVIDCKLMTRLLFIGLWNFADDGGVQPLRPHTIRMQVFPGDAVDAEVVRAMIDELAAQGLVRTYAVDGVEYVAIADWDQLQRVGKRARRGYPSAPGDVAGAGEAGAEPVQAIADHRSDDSAVAAAGATRGQPWRAIENHSIVASAVLALGEASEPPSRTIESHSNVASANPAVGKAGEPPSWTMGSHSNRLASLARRSRAVRIIRRPHTSPATM